MSACCRFFKHSFGSNNRRYIRKGGAVGEAGRVGRDGRGARVEPVHLINLDLRSPNQNQPTESAEYPAYAGSPAYAQDAPDREMSNSQIRRWPFHQAMYASFSLGTYRRLGRGSCAVSKLQVADPSNPLAQYPKLISNPNFPISEHSPRPGEVERKSWANRYVAFRLSGFAP